MKTKVADGKADDRIKSDRLRSAPLVTGQRIYLRAMEAADANQRYCDWMNDPVITRYLESRFGVINLEALKDWVSASIDNPDELLMAICTIEDHEHIGNIKIGPIRRDHRRADVGLIIGEKDYWGKGIATEAIALATKYAFETLDLIKMKAGCYENNEASARAFERCGWRREAFLRDEVIFEGKPIAVHYLGITARDYQELRKK